MVSPPKRAVQNNTSPTVKGSLQIVDAGARQVICANATRKDRFAQVFFLQIEILSRQKYKNVLKHKINKLHCKNYLDTNKTQMLQAPVLNYRSAAFLQLTNIKF